jgi:hypothetical protein
LIREQFRPGLLFQLELPALNLVARFRLERNQLFSTTSAQLDKSGFRP